MGVANERDFFRLVELSDDDEEYINLLVVNASPPILKEIHKNWLTIYRYPFKIRESLRKSGKEDPSFFDEIINDTEEKLHGNIEGSVIKYLEKLRASDVGFYNTEDGNIEFNFFLCEQYMRTKRRQQFVKEIDKKGKLIDLEKLALLEFEWNDCVECPA
jgi:hypothetical protein